MCVCVATPSYIISQNIKTEIDDSKSASFDSGKAKIMFVKVLDVDNQEVRHIVSEQLVKLKIGILFLQSFDDPMISFQLRDRTGLIVFQTNTVSNKQVAK